MGLIHPVITGNYPIPLLTSPLKGEDENDLYENVHK